MRRHLLSTTLLAIALAACPAHAADIAALESKVAAAGLKAEAADLLALAGAYEAAGRPLEAAGTLERAIAAGAGATQRRRLGRLWEAAGRFDQAALAYKAAATGADGGGAALDGAHVVARFMDDRRRALAEYVAVAKGWPGSPQSREALLATLGGDRWRDDLRDLRGEAEDLALAQFAADPAFAEPVAGAARRMAERKQGDQALAVVRRLPEGPVRMEAEADILARNGKGGEAADLWEHRWSTSRDPNHLLKAAECVDNSDRPRAARLWLTCAGEHPDNRSAGEFLERAWSFDQKSIPAMADALAKAWAGNDSRLAVLALYRARSGGDRTALLKDALARDAGALGLDPLADIARADAGARTLLAERGRTDDRAGWTARLAAALAQDGDAGAKAVAEAVRDGGMLDEGTARRALQIVQDRLWNQRDKAETQALVASMVQTVLSAPQHNDVREVSRRMAQEMIKDKAVRDRVRTEPGDDPVQKAWAARGHKALADLAQDPPAAIHPLRLLAVRLEAYRRATDRRETLPDAIAVARPLAAQADWAVRWAEALRGQGDGMERAQIEPCLQALAPVADAAGPRREAALQLTAALHLAAGRAGEATRTLAALPGNAAAWPRDARWTGAQAAAAAADKSLTDRVLIAAIAVGDGDLAWEMTAGNRWRAPEEWRIPGAQRAAEGFRDPRRRTDLLLWIARAQRDAGDGAGSAATLAKARTAAAGDPRALESVLLQELDGAQRRRDGAAEDAAARGLVANTEAGIWDWRGVGDGLRKWLEPRLAGMPDADTALAAVMRTGNQAGLWAAGQLADRQRAKDPIAAALTVQRMVRLAWREDRDAFDRLQALVQAEADAGRAGVAAGAFAHMAAWFSAERVGQDRIDAVRRLAAAQLAKAGGAALIDDRDPKAPLLRAAGLLAGGDEDEAWRMVKDQQKLLSEHMASVPADLVLLAARRFAGEGRIDTARTLVESLLRSQRDDGEGPARARLLLGDLAFREEDLPAATLEFQQVIATWPKSRAALEANLRLGDCLLAARQAEQARKIYEQFAEHEDDETRIRAHARLAMLEIQAGNKPKALELFREIAAMNPPRALADELYLDWGRALIGANRLQEAEDVLTMVGLAQGEDPVAPGEPLRITLRDPYLQTSQARSAVPVVVRTASGDEEIVDMTLSTEAKGVFAARIPTSLGAPVKGDRTLQVRGGDAITYDYTEDFKKGRKVVALGSGGIPIASDAQFKAAATLDGVAFSDEREASEQGLLNLGIAQADDEEAALARSASRTYRSGAQMKPGNPIYVAVNDPDRDVSGEPDRVPVILQSTAGDRVQVDLVETGPHTGRFQAEVGTGLRPADLAVSDSAPGANPAAMLAQPGGADHDRADRAWIAAGDRKPGKTVTIDLKQAVPVDRLVWSRGRGATDRRITAYRIDASVDGLAWSTHFDSRRPVALTGVLRWQARPAGRAGAVRTTRAAAQALGAVALAPARGQRPPEGVTLARTAAYDQPTQGEAGPVEHVAEGRVVIPAPGRYEFAVRGGGRCWVMVNGSMVVEKDRDEADPAGEPRWRGGLDLAYGQAAIKVMHGSETGLHGLTLLWRRPGQTTFEPIPAAALDEGASAKDIAALVGGTPAAATALADRHGADIAFKPLTARFVRMVIDEWADGDAPAISAITVSHGDKRLLPAPGVDYAALAANQVLELSAGDEVTASYRDEKNKRKVPEILRARLTATYFDGSVAPLETRTALVDGRLEEEVFQRYRFRAGDTISVRVAEFDADTTNQPDRIAVKVTSSAGTVTIDAIETDRATGVFQGEVRTRAAGGSASAPARTLFVKPGEQIQISYLDLANVRPGGPAERTAMLREVVESAGAIAILPTVPAAPSSAPGARPWTLGAPSASAAVILAPLHIQVTDPDALVSAGSRVRVRVRTERGAEQDLLLAPGGDPETGVFAGSIALALGSPSDGTLRVLAPGEARGSAAPAEPGPVGSAPVLPIVGGERITVTYLEGLSRTATPAQVAQLAARSGLPAAAAALATAGRLQLTEDDFETPVATLHVAGKLCMLVTDPDADRSDGRDEVRIEIRAASGDRLLLTLGETEMHSGVFTGSVPLTQGAAAPDDALQVSLGDRLTVTYQESGAAKAPVQELPVAKGHDAALSVFAKRFADDKLAARTQLRLAESWFEIYKRQRADLRTMERTKGRPADIAALRKAIDESLGEGISLLQRTVSDDPDGAEADQVLFLLGNFEQEAGNHDSAIDRYRSLLGQFPDSQRAAEAQYKIAQCHEERKRFDDAWEAYVRLAYRWPEHELVADAMARIGLFYDDRGRALARTARDAWLQANPGGDATLAPVPPAAVAEFTQAAAVYGKLVERFPDHRIADQIMLAQGNSLYQCARWLEAKAVFDAFLARYPNSPAVPKGLFWAAMAALEAGDAPGAYLRFGRVVQDYPESNEAKFARGRLLTDKRLKGIALVGEEK